MKWIVIAVVVSMTAAVWPCCSVTFDGNGVAFAGQANVIIWDAESKTEHFIRQARFESGAKDFGFIAPSPTVPELATAKPTVFQTLESLAPLRIGCGKSAFEATESSTASDSGGVEVIQVKDVGDYRATTLRAKDAEALAKWMRANGYTTTPAIKTWTEFYIAKDWYLTAFKIRSEVGDTTEMLPIRMTFKTEQPFNPYYVPSDNIDPTVHSTLEMFFVSKGSYRNQVPGSGLVLEPTWRERLNADTLTKLRADLDLPLSEVSAGWEVARYTDRFFPREVPDDLYFSYRSESSWAWTPARIAIDVAFVAVVIGGVVWWRRRRAVPQP